MGKILTILGADFSENGMFLLKAIKLGYNTASYQFVVNPTNTYWDGNTGQTVVTGGTPVTPSIRNLESKNLIGDDYTWLAFGSEEYGDNLKSAEILDTNKVLQNMKCMFVKCRGLESVVLSGKPTNMQGLFHKCDHLTEVDLSGLDTSEVTIMQDLFRECTALRNINLLGFDTSSVGNMKNMFLQCGVETLDLSNFDTSSVTSMESMFALADNLSSLTLSQSFDTSNVVNMSSMFQRTINLKQIDLSHFDTEKVTDMSYMFSACGAEVLDLTSFDMSRVNNVRTMFYASSGNGPKTIKFGPNLSLANISAYNIGFVSYCRQLTRIECLSLASNDSAIAKLKLLVSDSTNAQLSNSIDLVCSDTTLHWNGSAWA